MPTSILCDRAKAEPSRSHGSGIGREMSRSRRPLGIAVLAGVVGLHPSVASADPPATDLKEGQHFQVDPVADGLLVVGGAGLSELLSLVLSTGEIAPVPPGDPNNLLSFDRTAVTQTIDPHAALYSDIGLYTTIGYAALDSLLSGFRDGSDALLVDSVMYGESAALINALTSITKIAVRRPRPVDYAVCGGSTASTCGSTDLELSFFSGHASTVAALGATASYLAFVREPRSPRPWITLGAATAVTAFVSYERVRSGNHFPTDVVAGSLAGAAVGVLVPHLHRHKEEAPPVWIGATPLEGGGSVSIGAAF